MSCQYSQEAQVRISALGQAELVEFIEEIPQALRAEVYKRLPRVQGFRTGSQAELKEKQKRLIAHLNHPLANINDRFDWKNFALLWDAWAYNRFGKEFPKFDSAELGVESGLSFLKKLVAIFPNASREDVERLFIFSGFPDHPDIAMVYALFRPASAHIHDQMINGFSIRLNKLEAQINVAEVTVEDTAKRIKRLETASDCFVTNIEDAKKDISWTTNAVIEIRASLDAESDRAIKSANIASELGSCVEKLTDTVTTINTRICALEQSVHEIIAHATVLTKSVEAISTLVDRVAALEHILAANSTREGTSRQVKPLEIKQDGPFANISSIDDACTLVASNLQAVGIVKGTAIDIARQTVAGLICGQMVQFSGSLADLVVDAVAASIGGPRYHLWRVPVGLISGDAASDCIEMITESSGCLVLKGANLSAFEVYGATVRDVVVQRQFALPRYEKLALVASWAQGPAAFPDGGSLAELGPVFDTDSFSIRGRGTKLPQLQLGRLAKGAWNEVEGCKTDDSILEVTELRERLKEAEFEGTNLWRRQVNHVWPILRGIPGGTQMGDLRALLVSWVIPWAKAMGQPTEKIAQIANNELGE